MDNNMDVIFPVKRIELGVTPNNEVRYMSVARKSEYGLNVPETITKGEPTANGASDSARF